MSLMAAMSAYQMANGSGGEGGGGGPISSASSSAEMGDDYSRKMFQGITFGRTDPVTGNQTTNDTLRLGLLVLGSLAAIKLLKG